jgi:hypothetical protein
MGFVCLRPLDPPEEKTSKGFALCSKPNLRANSFVFGTMTEVIKNTHIKRGQQRDMCSARKTKRLKL